VQELSDLMDEPWLPSENTGQLKGDVHLDMDRVRPWTPSRKRDTGQYRRADELTLPVGKLVKAIIRGASRPALDALEPDVLTRSGTEPLRASTLIWQEGQLPVPNEPADDVELCSHYSLAPVRHRTVKHEASRAVAGDVCHRRRRTSYRSGRLPTKRTKELQR